LTPTEQPAQAEKHLCRSCSLHSAFVLSQRHTIGKTQAHKKTPQRGVFLCVPGSAGNTRANHLAAEASAAGAAAGAAGAAEASAAGATAAGAGAAGAAASSFLPQADKAAAAMMAAKTRDLFMVIFLVGLKTISGNCRSKQNACLNRDKSTRALLCSALNYSVFPSSLRYRSHEADAKPSIPLK